MVPVAFFADVGQGHATVIVDGGTLAVIDCPAGGVETVAALLRDSADKSSAVQMFVTHRDLDHCGGIPQIFEQFNVSRLVMNYSYSLPPESNAKRRVKAVLHSIFDGCDRAGIEVENKYAGASGHVGRVEWSVLSPGSTDAGRSTLTGKTNRSCLVIKFSYSDNSVLITGDVDDLALESLLSHGSDLASDVLLAPHHGARSVRFDELLQAVNPSVVVVSFGRRNPYGHPDPATLASAAQRCKVMCTQLAVGCQPGAIASDSCAGTIEVPFDGSIIYSAQAAHHDAFIATLSTPQCRRLDAK